MNTWLASGLSVVGGFAAVGWSSVGKEYAPTGVDLAGTVAVLLIVLGCGFMAGKTGASA